MTVSLWAWVSDTADLDRDASIGVRLELLAEVEQRGHDRRPDGRAEVADRRLLVRERDGVPVAGLGLGLGEGRRRDVVDDVEQEVEVGRPTLAGEQPGENLLEPAGALPAGGALAAGLTGVEAH